jgi:transcriptional regulator with XRE-family HTH domain
MGYSRPRPERLAEKLLQIREALGLSQAQMLARLGFGETHSYTRISSYELGRNEPPLMILLEYARTANVYVEALIDDDLDLPDQLPSPTKTEGTKRTSTVRPRSRKR